jgi:hypothetical protein
MFRNFLVRRSTLSSSMTPPLHASDMSEYVPQEHTLSPQRHLHTSSSTVAPASVALQIHSAYTAPLESTTVQGPPKPVLRTTEEGPLGVLWECGPGGLKGDQQERTIGAMSGAADVEATGHLDDLQPGGQFDQPERLQQGSQSEQPKSWQASGQPEQLPELQAGGHCESLALDSVGQPEQPATRLQAVCLPEQPATRLQAVCLPEQPATRLQAVCLPEHRPSSLAGQQYVRLGENGGRSCSLTRMPGTAQQLPVRDSAIAKSNRSD